MNGDWQRATVDLTPFGGQTVRLLVEAADAANGSIVEAGIDTLRVDVSTSESLSAVPKERPEPTGILD